MDPKPKRLPVAKRVPKPKQEEPPITLSPIFDTSDDEDDAHIKIPKLDYQTEMPSYHEDFIESNRNSAGRAGVDEKLWDVVGSRMARDIVRKNQWISQNAFNDWIRKDKNRQNKYAGVYEDRDGDNINEFVVYRKNKDGSRGPMIGVNGYTTKRSDYPFKREFYDKYPTRELRKAARESLEGGTLESEFAREYYDYDNHLDEFGIPNAEYMRQRAEKQGNTKYNLRMPNPSPYNLFTSRLVCPAINTTIATWADGDENEATNIRKKIDNKLGKGWMMSLVAKLWNEWIKKPIIEELHNKGLWNDFKDRFTALKKQRDPTFKIDSNARNQLLIDWIFKKKGIKNMVLDYAKPLFNNNSDDAYKATKVIISIMDAIKEQL